MIKNVIYFIASIVVFAAGIITYGILTNYNDVPLSECMAQKGIKTISDPSIVIEKNSYRLSLYSDTVLVKSYKAVFGRTTAPVRDYSRDKHTPIGKYSICSIDTLSKYRKFLKINYPNCSDAAEAYRIGYITKEEFEEICQNDYWGTDKSFPKFGGAIGICGIGQLNSIFKNLPFVYNWTNGSVAVSNESIDEIYSVIKIGTQVVIKN